VKSKWIWIAATLALGASPARAEVVNRIVASVDGEPITAYELQQYQAKQRAMMPGAPLGNERDMLQALITEKLVAREIAERGIRVRDDDIDHYIDRIKEANRVNDEELREALKQQGMDYEKYREQIRQEIEKVQLVNREIRGKVNVTPEDVDRYYEAHKKDYEQPGGVKVQQITLRLEPTAPEEIAKTVIDHLEALRTRILKGEKFSDIAKQYSEDPLAAEGGELGEVDPSKLLPEFESALAKMKEGDVSEPIRSKAGVHLLRLEKRIPTGYRPQEEVAAEIKEKLYNEALDERYKRWLLEDLQKHHYIEIKL